MATSEIVKQATSYIAEASTYLSGLDGKIQEQISTIQSTPPVPSSDLETAISQLLAAIPKLPNSKDKLSGPAAKTLTDVLAGVANSFNDVVTKQNGNSALLNDAHAKLLNEIAELLQMNETLKGHAASLQVEKTAFADKITTATANITKDEAEVDEKKKSIEEKKKEQEDTKTMRSGMIAIGLLGDPAWNILIQSLQTDIDVLQIAIDAMGTAIGQLKINAAADQVTVDQCNSASANLAELEKTVQGQQEKANSEVKHCSEVLQQMLTASTKLRASFDILHRMAAETFMLSLADNLDLYRDILDVAKKALLDEKVVPEAQKILEEVKKGPVGSDVLPELQALQTAIEAVHF